MKCSLTALLSSISFSLLPFSIHAIEPGEDEPVDFPIFEGLMQQYCLECHDSLQSKGGLDLETEGSEHVLRSNADLLDNMLWSLEEQEMPPKRAAHTLGHEDRVKMMVWLDAALNELRNSRPNDPGNVVMARLNHHQYQNIIRDLSGGVEIDVVSVLSRDGGGASGFPNDGASLNLSATQVEKFLSLAKLVLSHTRITPGEGIVWNDSAMLPLQNVNQLRSEIVQEYGRLLSAAYEPLVSYEKGVGLFPDLTDTVGMEQGAFFEAAYYYHHRAAFGKPDATIEDIAADYEVPLPAIVLEKYYKILTRDPADLKVYVRRVAEKWNKLPVPAETSKEAIREACRDLQQELKNYARQSLDNWGGQWDNRIEVSDHRKPRGPRNQWSKAIREEGVYSVRISGERLDNQSDEDHFWIAVSPAGDGNEDDVVIFSDFASVKGETDHKPKAINENLIEIVSGESKREDGNLVVIAPAVVRIKYPSDVPVLQFSLKMHPKMGRQGTIQFGVYTEENKIPDDLSEIGGRLVIYHPDSERGKILSEARAQAENVVSGREWNHGKYVVPEDVAGKAPEEIFPQARAVLPSPWDTPRKLTVEELISYGGPELKEKLETKVRILQDTYREYSKADQMKAGVALLRDFSHRAWRGRGTEEDFAPLVEMLEDGLEQDLLFEKAVKVPLTAILVHPLFIFHVQESEGTKESYALEPHELASRLSFTIWGSISDERLLELADNGTLTQPEVLREEVRRMLADDRAEALAHDFAGYWLGYEGFEDYSSVDKERYPEFTDSLRQAMFDEVILFVDGILRKGEPVTDALDSDYTYLNQKLAEHYGIDDVKGHFMRKVKLPADSPRGGVVTMAALLTKTSKPLRTSPVLRGDWILQEILGVHVPAPPDNIPLLSDDDVSEDGLTFLEQLEKHRADPACAGCHSRMDPLGIALENFDPVGAWREKSHSGVEVTNSSELPNGEILTGVEGLKNYMLERQELFLEHLCYKFTAYALGRKVLATDQQLLEDMKEALVESDHQFSAILETLVLSEQFRMRRDELASAN